MKKEKTIGGIVAFVIVTFLSWTLHGVDIPFPGSYVGIIFAMNSIFAFVSIFIQRLVIVLYEVNVFEKPNSAIGYAFKYFAICSSGLNYYVQTICNRLPFIMNKLVAMIFFVYMALAFFSIGYIFN